MVRTGTKRIGLIDGDKVEVKNLNRMIGFLNKDVGKKKVVVLKKKLKKINPDIEDPIVIKCHFKEVFPGDQEAQKGRDLIADSDIIIISMDNNESRILCEELCREFNKDYISIGVGIDKKKGLSHYECTWKPNTSPDNRRAEGYGPENGSFASIILEATAAGFHLMLHHLQNPDSHQYRYYDKEYLNFIPQRYSPSPKKHIP